MKKNLVGPWCRNINDKVKASLKIFSKKIESGRVWKLKSTVIYLFPEESLALIFLLSPKRKRTIFELFQDPWWTKILFSQKVSL